ncbi:hypothetical protein [Mycoplasma struthionis]|uniref:Uncharacterized protein n=1 Tax=Mycoplasma struthionis TaxID=538220 RepID=A0A502M2W5_9MOLU|nr:hypothetical protein [Mycoplasma struthionis]TPI03082.1 hypothetical protein FJM01_00005 [Mycoplasma struthionis]
MDHNLSISVIKLRKQQKKKMILRSIGLIFIFLAIIIGIVFVALCLFGLINVPIQIHKIGGL